MEHLHNHKIHKHEMTLRNICMNACLTLDCLLRHEFNHIKRENVKKKILKILLILSLNHFCLSSSRRRKKEIVC